MASFFVNGTTGSNGNNGTSAGQAWATIGFGFPQMTPGDILNIAAGVYNEALGAAQFIVPSGAPGNPIIIRGSGGIVEVSHGIGILQNTDLTFISYITFENLHLRGVNGSLLLGTDCHHIRFVNCDFTSEKEACTFVATGSFSHEFLNCVLHDASYFFNMGVPEAGAYGCYMSGHDVIFDGCLIRDNNSYGLHIFQSSATDVSNNIVRNCIFTGNGFDDSPRNNSFGAITINNGSNNQFYNNLVYGNNGGVEISFLVTGTKIYNNTITGNLIGSITNGSGATDTQVFNNICFNNIDGNAGTQISDNGGAGFTTGTNLLAIDPLFVNAGANDYRIQAGSPAINAGTTFSEVPSDLLGVTRPQGGAYDIGAYEFVSGGGLFQTLAGGITPIGIARQAITKGLAGVLSMQGHLNGQACLVSSGAVSDQSTATTVALNTTGASLLVIGLNADGGATFPAVSDSKGNAWVELTLQAPGFIHTKIFYVEMPIVGPGHTFTFTGTNVFSSMHVAAFCGIKLIAPFDKQSGAGASGVMSLQPGSITPDTNGELIYCYLGVDPDSGTASIDNGFTKIIEVPGQAGFFYGGVSAFLIQGTAGAINPTWSWSASSAGSTVIASFRVAVAGTSTQGLTGTLTPVGALAKAVMKGVGGVVTPGGVLTRAQSIAKVFSGGITPVGNIALMASKTLTGFLSPVGSLASMKILAWFLAGAVTPVGTVAKQAAKGIGGAVTATGSMARAVFKVLGGTVTPTGIEQHPGQPPVGGGAIFRFFLLFRRRRQG